MNLPPDLGSELRRLHAKSKSDGMGRAGWDDADGNDDFANFVVHVLRLGVDELRAIEREVRAARYPTRPR